MENRVKVKEHKNPSSFDDIERFPIIEPIINSEETGKEVMISVRAETL